jgi:carbonic anhydrase
MCDRQGKPDIDRRSLALAGLGMVAASFGLRVGGTSAQEQRHEKKRTSFTPDQALAALKEGNARYASNPQACIAGLLERRIEVSAGQAPWATIVGCSDSRVPPELLFGGLGLGELFVARNAGNLVDTATMGTVEYSVEHLGSPLVVVLGHERCGAVIAACDVVANGATFPGSIGPMIQPIVPVATAMSSKPGDFVDNTVRESARRTAKHLATASPIIADLVKAGKVKVLAARYDLDDGRVEYLS